jgi:hypothetical protein
MALSSKLSQIGRDDAELLAIEAFAFLAAEKNRIVPFLKATGLTLSSIQDVLYSTDFLKGVLDFLLNDESLLLVFASHRALDPHNIATARRALEETKTK